MDLDMTNTAKEDTMDKLPFWSHIFALTLYIILFLMAVLGNSVALLILRRKQELRTLTHAFLTNLVIADLLLALLTPFEALSIFLSSYAFGNIGCKLQRTFLYFFYAASILTLSAISLERFIAICYPMKYDSFKDLKTKIIVLIWFISLAIVSPHIYLSEQRKVGDDTVCFQFYTTESRRVAFFWGFSLPIFFLLYLIPLIIVSLTYWKASQTLAEMEKRLTKTSQIDLSATVTTRKEVLQMLLVVVVVFVIQWTPFEIVELIAIAPGQTDINPIGPLRVSVNMVAFLNAVFNPIVFGFMSKPFREGFKETGMYLIMCKCCPCSCRQTTIPLHRNKNNVTGASSLTNFSEVINTTQCNIDWDRSFSKLSDPISVVEDELQNVPEKIDEENCVFDQKL